MTLRNGAAAAPGTATVDDLATEQNVLDLRSTVLIGIVGKSTEPSALLRRPDGTITKVSPGDKTRAGTVIAIDAGSVSLRKGRKVKVLRLPHS